jgi:hypothetical protein
MVYASMIGAFTLTGAFKPLAIVASGSILLIDLGVSLATIKLVFRDGRPGPRQFSVPGRYAIPILSRLVIGWLCGVAALPYVAGIVFRRMARSSQT